MATTRVRIVIAASRLRPGHGQVSAPLRRSVKNHLGSFHANAGSCFYAPVHVATGQRRARLADGQDQRRAGRFPVAVGVVAGTVLDELNT